MYPSLAMSANISRDTKHSTTLWIEGCPYTLEEIDALDAEYSKTKDSKRKSELKNKLKAMTLANCDYINTYFGMISSPDENAVQLCHELFGMPDFAEMNQLFQEYYR